MPTYLDASQVTATRESKAPANRSRTGYGPKLATSLELQIGKRWHRVYVMQWSNIGTPYILIKRARVLLGAYRP